MSAKKSIRKKIQSRNLAADTLMPLAFRGRVIVDIIVHAPMHPQRDEAVTLITAGRKNTYIPTSRGRVVVIS